METFGQILAKCRKEAHYTQKAAAQELNERFGLSVKDGSVSSWEKDIACPNVKQLFAMCEIYRIKNINETFGVFAGHTPLAGLNEEGMAKVYEYVALLLKSGEYQKRTADILPFRRKLPVFLQSASAGRGEFLLDSDYYDTREVGDEVSPQADFGITLNGDSMEPMYISGQTVWVHKQDVLNPGDIGIFYYQGNAFCKQYTEKDGQVWLISLNPKYDPIAIDEDKGFRIFGKVVGG